MDLLKRMKATQRTVDRFKGVDMVIGTVDCVQLAAAHASHMGRKIKLPRYTDFESGGRALRAMGYRTLAEAMDAHFTRIQPAEAIMGDYIEMPGGNGFSALSVAVGNGRVIGFHESIAHADILQPKIVSGAWRIV